VNLKDLGRKQSWNNLKYYTVMCLQELRWLVYGLRFVFLFQTQSWNAAHCVCLWNMYSGSLSIFLNKTGDLQEKCYERQATRRHPQNHKPGN
jgi:hypothetical protein